MTPSIRETYATVVGAMAKAALDEGFGWRLLLGGKSRNYTKMCGSSSEDSKQRRENWLVEWIAGELRECGIRAESQKKERIDIAVLDAVGVVRCAIEAKRLSGKNGAIIRPHYVYLADT